MLRGCFLLASVLSCYGLTEELVITNDVRPVFHIVSFGYEPAGKIEMKLTDFLLMVPADYTQPTNDKYNIAFVFAHSTSDVPARLDSVETDYCFHESGISADDDVISLSDRESWFELNFEKTIVNPGYYHLYFSNCEKTTHTSFTAKIEEYNVDSSGQKVYLSAGEQTLPLWFFAMCFFFVAQLVVWTTVMNKNRPNIKSIHYLMTVVLIFKILTLFCESFKTYSLKTTGHNNGWSIVFYVFSFLKGTLLFAVIVLIGTGWSYLKPFLTDRDKQIMIAVLVVQMMVNIAMVVLDEMAPGSAGWLTWTDMLHLLDIICCCVILLPIVWSIRHLRSAAGTDGKASRNMSRLKNFRTFYLSVVSYIYFTRIIVYLLGATLPFEFAWIGTVFAEVAAFVFYATTGYLFRPQETNPYLAMNKDDEAEVAEMAAVAAL